MRLRDLEINTETFYKVGIFCFVIISLMNVVTLIILWDETLLSGKVGSIAGIIFYIALTLMFNYLLNMSRPEMEEEFASEDIEDLIKQVKNDKLTRNKEETKTSKKKATLS